MVAPVLQPRQDLADAAGSAVRSVYFPKAPPGGAVRYTHRFTNQTYAAGSTAQVPVPKLDEFPLFVVSRA